MFSIVKWRTGVSKWRSPAYGAIITSIYTLTLTPLVYSNMKELLVGKMYDSWQLGGWDLK